MPEPPNDDRRQVKPLDYERWPQRRKTPRPIKILLWAAILIHALGIIPAATFFWFAVTDESSRLADVLMSGACCIPFSILALLSLMVVIWRMSDADDN
jgi:hypothetical protein